MRILVSNDDGIYSPGIAALAEVASEFGKSGWWLRTWSDRPRASRSRQPFRCPIDRLESATWRPTASTARRPIALRWARIIGTASISSLSGLNLGFNLGNAIWHSGTLAAAKQAVLLGVRGVALSVPAGIDQDFEPVKPWIRRVLDIVIAEPSLSLINVNLPREPRGLLWTGVSVRQYDGRIVPTKDPQGRDLFWFTVKPLEHADEGTDRWAVEQNWISLTPLRIDLTDEAQLSAVEERRPLDRALARATSPRDLVS